MQFSGDASSDCDVQTYPFLDSGLQKSRFLQLWWYGMYTKLRAAISFTKLS